MPEIREIVVILLRSEKPITELFSDWFVSLLFFFILNFCSFFKLNSLLNAQVCNSMLPNAPLKNESNFNYPSRAVVGHPRNGLESGFLIFMPRLRVLFSDQTCKTTSKLLH